MIGANNAGKTSTLDAIEYLVTDKKLDITCRSKYIDENDDERTCEDDIILEGLFDDVDLAIERQRGFNASRLIRYVENGEDKYSFKYRVRVTNDGKNHREILMHKQKLKPEFEGCRKWQDYIDN